MFKVKNDVTNAEIRALYWKKERKVSLTDCKWNSFSSRIYTPSPPNIGPSNLKVLQIRIGRFQEISSMALKTSWMLEYFIMYNY